MASRMEDDQLIRHEGEMLVRRFTDSLNGDSQLEEASVVAQNQDDRVIQESHEARLRRLYEDQSRDPSDVDFYAADIARSALERACKKFADETKPSKLSKIGFHRKTSRMAANELVQQSMAQDFGELQQAIDELEMKWRSTHGPVYRNFQRLCNSLDAHKQVFAIFPQQNTYCAVLVGSLSLFVGAAVNHDEVAETISKTVADISVKAARCSKLIQVVTTQSMRELLAELYGHVFQFYRDVMEWYLSSKTSKFFGSFNEKLKERFEKAGQDIQNCIDEMYREADIAALAMLSMVNTTTTDMRNEVIRQRQQPYDDSDIATAGRLMRELLRAIHQNQASGQPLRIQARNMDSSLLTSEDGPKESGRLTRIQARERMADLEKHIFGSEGHSLFGDGRFWIAEIDASAKLQEWLDDDAKPTILWISSPEASRGMSSAQAAAMTAVAAAWHSETPIISHFCKRPHSSEIAGTLNVEQAGLLGLVYGLISQLLQFTIEDDQFEISEEECAKLNGSEESWSICLSIFSKLMETTPHLAVCVIYGLNDLAWSNNGDWCRAFLDILLKNHATDGRGPKVLLATSGQARVLPDYIPAENRYFARKAAREIVRTSRPTKKEE